MAVDYCVSFECETKEYFGGGDALKGTVAILDMLKADSRGNVIRELAEQDGRNPNEMEVTLHVPGPHGHPIEKQVTLAELERESAPLKARGQACIGCPANVRQSPYGCIGAINYPVARDAELWLLERVYSSGDMGAYLCYGFMKDNRISGNGIRQLRKSGFFEIEKSPKVIFKKGFFSSKSVTSDQIFEILFSQDQFIAPEICLNVLLWLGAIKVQGRVPVAKEDNERIAKLLSFKTSKEKSQWTSLEIGSERQDPAVVSMGEFVKAMYLSWVLGVPLLVSA